MVRGFVECFSFWGSKRPGVSREGDPAGVSGLFVAEMAGVRVSVFEAFIGV